MSKIQISERLYEKRKSVRTAIALSMRYWQSYRIIGFEKTAEDTDLIKRAYHIAVSLTQYNRSDTDLHLCRVFMCIEMGDFTYADELLNTVSQYRNFFKSNEPVQYAIFLFLSALLELKRKKARPARKFNNQLVEFASDKPGWIYPLLMGILSLGMYQYEQSYRLLSECYHKGCRSGFLYIGLFDYYTQASNVGASQELLVPLVNWIVTQGGDVRRIIDSYEESISLSLAESNGFIGRLINIYQDGIFSAGSGEWILKEICKNMIRNLDYSMRAYHYYREAELKQMYLPGLNSFLVKSACMNNVENISRYSMEEFIQSGDMDISLKVYVYHIVLTNKKLKELSETYSNEIIQFCMYCIENKMTGRYYNSIYKYFLDICREQGMSGEYMQKAEEYILADLFTYQVRTKKEASDVRYVYIKSKENRDMELYELVEGQARVSATMDNFTYFCLSADKRRIIDEKLEVIKLVENADISLYMHFYKMGMKSFELLVSLYRYCISLEKPGDECIGILNGLLNYNQLSTTYRMSAKAFIGNVYYMSGDYETAMSFYRGVDENWLADKYIEQMLTVFIDTGELEGAARLVEKKSQCISDRALFYALKKLSNDESYHTIITDVAYELLLKSWYDKSLLNVVIKNYKGGQEEWQELAKALANISVSEENLDELVLVNSIWMHRFDVGSQQVFVRMYNNTPDNKMVEKFAYYCIYEMIINKVKPIFETVTVLEKIYLQNLDRFLCYALCSTYLENDIVTLHSEAILADGVKYQEEDQILFPVFKTNRDKKKMSPYIEKIQPFIYRGLPDKNVWIYYRTDNGDTYISKKMQYVRFGMYMTTLVHFYGETIKYYFCEEMPTGSIVTLECTVENNDISFNDEQDDSFFTINNALIYERMFKYEQVEKIITDTVKEMRKIRGRIL